MNILAVGCHPDDLEIGCGGTLAKLSAQDHCITMVHVASGEKGHKVIPSEELVQIRKQEALSAGSLIQAEVVSLGLPDLLIRSNNDSLISQLTDIIRRVKPDYMITHPRDDYMKDHMEVSMAVFDASFNASVTHYQTAHPAYERVVPIYYMDTLAGVNFIPTEYVDISGFIDTKLKMLDCHQSQITWMREHDDIDFLDFVQTVSKFRGLQCGTAFAEGFTQCQSWPRLTTSRMLP